MAATVDRILEDIGGFGRYQWMLLSIFGYAIVSTTFAIMIVTFITAEPAWICVKGYNNSVCNFTEPIGLTSKNYSARCSMPREAWTYVEGFTSTVTEYDLVCDKSYLLSIAQSCSWTGMLVASLIGGFAADRYGRRIVYYIGLVGTVIGTWVMVFPQYFAVFIAARTFVGLALGLQNAPGFVLLTEFTGRRHRATIGVTSFYFWVLALQILALLGYLLPNWHYLLLTTAVVAIPVFCLWWFIPESTRWFLQHGEPDKATEQLVKIARINKKPFPQVELKIPNVEEKGNFCHLFSNLKMTKRTLICWNIWITIALVYYGVSYGSVDLGWNRYLTFALTSLIELPSNYASIWSMDRYGRKKSTTFGLVIASVASIVAVSFPYVLTIKDSTHVIFRVSMAVIAKFAINLSFSCIYIWTVELFPTVIRSIALSTSSASGRIGSFAASYVIWLIRVHPVLPFGIMGFMCLQSAILSLFLPETNGQPTMETMADVDQKNDILLLSSLQEDDAVANNSKRHLGEMYVDQLL